VAISVVTPWDELRSRLSKINDELMKKNKVHTEKRAFNGTNK